MMQVRRLLVGISPLLAVMLSLAAQADESALRESGSGMFDENVELRFHDEDYTRLPYSLDVPRHSVQDEDSVASEPDGLLVGGYMTNHGFVPRPSDYNIPRQFALSNNYAVGEIASWQGGGLFASSAMNVYPGMGNIATGGVSLTQDFGRFSFTGSFTGSKYHLDNRLYDNFGVSGRLSYRLSDRVTLNAFGSYQRGNGLYHSMAAMPFLASSNYGATMGVQMSDKFSMEMGAQRYYDPFSHKWMTVPILIPQINLGGQKIGIDVGGLLYEILYSLLRDYNDGQRQIAPGGMPARPPRFGIHPFK